jgi:hypothetical protein
MSAQRGVLVLATLLFVGVAVPYLYLPHSGDHAYFAHFAWRVREGAVPYRDLLDQNMPGALLIELLAEGVFGPRMSAIRALDVAWMAITLGVMHRVGSRFLSPLSASVGLVFAIGTYFTLGHHPTAQRDGFCLLFLLVAVVAATETPQSVRGGVLAGLVVGVCTAAAFLLKPPAVLAAAVPATAVLARGRSGVAARTAALAASFSVPILALLLYLWRNDALTPFYDSVVLFNREYFGERRGSLALLFALLAFAARYPVVGVGMLGMLVGLASSRTRFLAAFSLSCLLPALGQGKLTDYHLVPFALLLCLWCGHVVVVGLRDSRFAPLSRLAAIAVVFVFAFSFVDAFRFENLPRVWLSLARTGDATVRREEMDVAKRIQQYSAPGESVLVWGIGTSGLIHTLAHRPSPTRFTTDYPFSLDRPDSELVTRWRAEFLRELRAHPPRLVLVVEGDSWPGLGNLDSTQSFERFTALRDFVREQYVPFFEMGGKLRYRVFRFRD